MNTPQLLAHAVEDQLNLPVRCRRPIRGRRRFRLVGETTGDLSLMAREPDPKGKTPCCAVLRLQPAKNLDILRDLIFDREEATP